MVVLALGEELGEYAMKEIGTGYTHFAHNYHTGSWDGEGYGYALDESKNVHEWGLGHCSCYGPTDRCKEGETVWTLDEFKALVLGDNVTVGTIADLPAAKKLLEIIG